LTTVLLLVLALAWGVILLVWLRSRASETFSDSVGTFRQRLRVLQPDSPYSDSGYPGRRGRTGEYPTMGRGYRRDMTGPGYGPSPRAAALAARRRRESQRRRRDVLGLLAAVVVLSLVVAALSGSKAAVLFQVCCDLLFGGYVALLVRMRTVAAEREMRPSYFGAQSAYRGAPAVRPRSPRPRRRPAPSYELAYDDDRGYGGYEFAPGYGELAFRRAAN
jgi:hypothetical protein